MTRNLVIGSSNSASLTRGGSQLVALVTDDFPGPGDQAMEPGAKKPEG
jgi:hypothetical protein